LLRKIVLFPHDQNWSALFEEEKNILVELFGRELISIHHIGSTAIPGLHAKPIIDNLIEVGNIQKVDHFNPDMMALTYEPKGEYGIPRKNILEER
jgi:GrpB-like predicted nucleotidyltransferase (UPF0157 family)